MLHSCKVAKQGLDPASLGLGSTPLASPAFLAQLASSPAFALPINELSPGSCDWSLRLGKRRRVTWSWRNVHTFPFPLCLGLRERVNSTSPACPSAPRTGSAAPSFALSAFGPQPTRLFEGAEELNLLYPTPFNYGKNRRPSTTVIQLDDHE